MTKNILTRFQTLKNVGLIKNATVTSEIKSKDGLNLVRIYLDIEDEVIKNANFKCFGGILLTVSTDILCDLMENKNINEIANIEVASITQKLGEIEENNLYIIEFALSIIKELLKDYNKKIEKENKKNKVD